MDEDLEVRIITREVYSQSTPELDILLRDVFLTEDEEEKHDYCDVGLNHTDNSYCDGYPAPIEVIKKMIADAEACGANYIYIDYHCDHIEFDVQGFKLERETKGDIEDRKAYDEAIAKEKKEDAIVKLEEKLAKLKKDNYKI